MENSTFMYRTTSIYNPPPSELDYRAAALSVMAALGCWHEMPEVQIHIPEPRESQRRAQIPPQADIGRGAENSENQT
jgi:hypothetical protein